MADGARGVPRRREPDPALAGAGGGRAYFGTFEQAPACINVLDLGADGTWIVRTVNYIPYDPLHPSRTTTMEHLWSELKPWLDERT